MIRSTGTDKRGAWAAYAQSARESAMLGKTELARRLGVDRGTVHRWEIGQTKPEDPAIVYRFAQVLKLDPEDAMAAAGLRPDREAPTKAIRQESDDEKEIRLVYESKLSDGLKRRMIQYVLTRQARDRQARIEEARMIAEAAGEDLG